ncbi:MAG: tRNA (N6-threonylcarbamoyladenosine(37)-N6)-methyltransferase TrmO [Povalibacter sp.]
MATFELRSIGRVESDLDDIDSAPRQADEGAPPAWLVFDQEVIAGLGTLRAGDEIIVITWLQRARRDVLRVHPRGDITRPAEGVFNTRSPHRPNPIGLHRVRITQIESTRIEVSALEAINGTPIIDLKPVLAGEIELR